LFSNTQALRNEIINLANSEKLDKLYYKKMLDYTIELFETQGLGTDYYGYHNIEHELEVTYVTLLAASRDREAFEIKERDLEYLYTASLFHDFDPQKSIDKPHEESVVQFISLDKELKKLLDEADLDIDIITVLILRTAYPWAGKLKEDAEKKIKECFNRSEITKNNKQKQEHFMDLGWFLSIVDRVSGYALGDFSKALEMAKKNAHALTWHPSLITKRSVSYFEDLLNNESRMCQNVLRSLPNEMRKNFMNSVLSFMRMREREIKIESECVFDRLKLVPFKDPIQIRRDNYFISKIFSIYDEMPKPLQLTRIGFTDSIKNDETILVTLRKNDNEGEIVGFAKGGPLENYTLRKEISDENFGQKNTIFLEPVALKMGYWGFSGGSQLRELFYKEAREKNYKFLTSFGLRDVIRERVSKESAEFVRLFDPEHWDYYRVNLLKKFKN
jgi:hypothetical protein